MGFEIDLRQTSLRRDMRRVAREQIDAALEDLAAGQQAGAASLPEQVHSLRKRTKKLRALVRMLGTGLADHQRDLKALRNMARRLAGLRDAEVMLATFDALAGAKDAVLRARLDQARLAAYDDATLPARLDQVRGDLTAFRARLDRWHLTGKGFALVERGVHTACRDARSLLDLARLQPETEAIHDWRKRVKDHCYQARLLRPIWPEAMDQTISAAAALEEQLGLIHDLDVLMVWLRDQPEAGQAAPMIRRALARRQSLVADCLQQGTRLFAGSAKDTTRRWQTWWQVARTETAA